MELIKEALTFDDVLLEPQYSNVLPSDVSLNQKLSKKLILRLPFLSAAMDTVTESKMAIVMARLGGIGVIHRNLNISKQLFEVEQVKKKNLIVGAAVGTDKQSLIRVKNLIEKNIDLLVIDTAHGHSKKVLNMVEKIKKITHKIPLCVGNIATGKAATQLYNVGADILKVGIGPGSICTTRIVAGIGVPQITAIANVKNAISKKYKNNL